MVFRYQAASWRLLVGARARFRVASRRYSPTEGPCFRLGAWASMVRTKSSCWARSQRAAVAPKSRSSAHRGRPGAWEDRKSTRLNSSHVAISYAVFCLKKKKKNRKQDKHITHTHYN